MGRPSQCIYRMIQDFLTHGNDPWYFIVHGIYPWFFTHSHFSFLGPFWREWGYVTLNAQLSCIYGRRNNNVLDHLW